MFGFLKKKPAGIKQYTREEKFAAIEAFRHVIMKRGGISVSSRAFDVKVHVAAACFTSASLTSTLGAGCAPFVDLAFATLRDHLITHTDQIGGVAELSEIFSFETRFLPFNKRAFFDAKPHFEGVVFASSHTLYDALLDVFGVKVATWVFSRRNSPFGLNYAGALMCIDLVYGSSVEADVDADMELVSAFLNMIGKISTPDNFDSWAKKNFK